jgi:hypothetical protein
MDHASPDVRTLLRDRLLGSDLADEFVKLPKGIGKVEYPPWIRLEPNHWDVAMKKIFIDNFQTVINDDMSEGAYVAKYSSNAYFFETGTACLSCRFILLASCCPQLVATNIISWANLCTEMEKVNKGIVITHDDLKQTCFPCQTCGKLLPGRFKEPQYLSIVWAVSQWGCDPISCYEDHAEISMCAQYDEMVKRTIARDDLLIVCNDVIQSGLSNIIGEKTTRCYEPKEDLLPTSRMTRIFSWIGVDAVTRQFKENSGLAYLGLKPFAHQNLSDATAQPTLAWEILFPGWQLRQYLGVGRIDLSTEMEIQWMNLEISRDIAGILCNMV